MNRDVNEGSFKFNVVQSCVISHYLHKMNPDKGAYTYNKGLLFSNGLARVSRSIIIGIFSPIQLFDKVQWNLMKR